MSVPRTLEDRYLDSFRAGLWPALFIACYALSAAAGQEPVDGRRQYYAANALYEPTAIKWEVITSSGVTVESVSLTVG